MSDSCRFPPAVVQGQAASTDFISGVVQGQQGPEAGVWVIAETNDLPTKLIKIVVTDDQGRFVLPDLPTATYSVWVRGYGLVDSTPIDAEAERHVHRRCERQRPRNAAGSREGVSGQLLAVAHGAAGRSVVSRHRATPATGSGRRC